MHGTLSISLRCTCDVPARYTGPCPQCKLVGLGPRQLGHFRQPRVPTFLGFPGRPSPSSISWLGWGGGRGLANCASQPSWDSQEGRALPAYAGWAGTAAVGPLPPTTCPNLPGIPRKAIPFQHKLVGLGRRPRLGQSHVPTFLGFPGRSHPSSISWLGRDRSGWAAFANRASKPSWDSQEGSPSSISWLG